MARTIIMADETERTFDKVIIEQGFAVCYNRRDLSWFKSFVLDWPTYKQVTTIPANRIKEIQ